VLVIDASVLAVALVDDGADGDALRARLRGETLSAPSLIDLEVVSVWRGLARGGHLDARQRCWQLRDNLTIYDAAYVALAEALQVTLLTGDQRLARASGPTCPIEVIKTTPSSR
jgi:predicted nucleic acid-binding protein